MKLTDCIAYVGRVKPNAFTDEDVARWVSEVEGLVCTEVFQIDPTEFRPYVLTATYTADGVSFPASDLIRLKSPLPEEFSAGGILSIAGGSLYAANAGDYRILSISADGCEIRIDTQLPATGPEEDTEEWTLDFDGRDAVLLVRPPHDKLYAAYVIAQIDFANGEYTKYENSLRMFNAYWGEYCRWYSRRFRPADRDVSKTGAYLSAYTVAVKHGYRGTEEEWLRSLHGEDGNSGVWISDDLSEWPDEGRHLWIIREDEPGEEITVPDGLQFQDNTIVLMDGSAPVGDPIPLSVGLPAVNATDNGAILGVVNGVWAKTTLEEWTGGNY